MTGFDYSDLIDYLSEQGIANVQNGLIHALGIWMDEHISGDLVMQRKEAAWTVFRGAVSVALDQKDFQRKTWPEDQPLPDPVNNLEIYKSIHQKALQKIQGLSFEQGLLALGKIWGSWILTCPVEIYLHSPQFEGRANLGRTDSEIIGDFCDYLDMIYGDMG